LVARRFHIALLLVVALVLCGCRGDAGDGVPPYIEAGDLPEVVERGSLRILLPIRGGANGLPRDGRSLDFERQIAAEYAASMGLEPIFVFVGSRDQFIPYLNEGKVDLIAANLTATAQRREQVDFTVPLATVREQIVARAGDDLTTVEQLEDRRIALRRSSSFWHTVEKLQERIPGITIVEVEEDVDAEEMIERVATGEYDLTVADSNLVESCLTYRKDIRSAVDLTRDRPIAWAVRKNSPKLRASLDRYLFTAQLAGGDNQKSKADLPEIKQRKVLRLLTRNMAASYFLYRGRLMGFEYELAKRFAELNGMRLEVVVPPSGEDLLPWLRDGKGDIVAASLTPTPERMKDGVVFSKPYNQVAQVIVARSDEPAPANLEELSTRTIVVRRSSAYWKTLQELLDAGYRFDLQPAPEEMETEEIIEKVATGDFDLTLSDSHILGIELIWRDDVQMAFAVKEKIDIAWAVRESNPLLKQAVDDFIGKEHRSLFYNVIYNRYFRDQRKIRRHAKQNRDEDPSLSPYDALVKKYASEHGFDWRLVVSQMYQESRFDPEAQSFAGARGLMQMLPRTGEELGFEDLHDPEIGIQAGVRYLDWLRDRFDQDLPARERMWFMLAAYNAGPGHVRDARRLAQQQGRDPNRWFGHVEEAMLLLSRPQYAAAARHGYCRCSEPVRYVREIRDRFNSYVTTVKAADLES